MPTPTPTTRQRLAASPAPLLLIALAAVALVGAIVLAAIHTAVPAQLWTAFFAALAGGAGVAHPGGGQ